MARNGRKSARNRIVPVNERIHVEFEVEQEINYSLLHNNGDLVKKLTITRLVADAPINNIAVQVELNVGERSYPYRYTLPELTEVQKPLAEDVRVPLTATLTRSLRERVHSTVYVKVSAGGETA